ncbi:MAG: histidine phosphatase family protein [Dehalococcoidales bacterium]|nr:histidine phosphatase family protein [Dehalococcoidales bacterium]MDP7285743.1 histidine phosphatase family protein [Dehalococcoidales bacterium]MDP7415570.1 histidine phosphatase family protein [Dehalococcoidales bacterium]
MTTTVLLARHGQTESNIRGYFMGRLNEDLNGTGYNQARCLASRLARASITSVYTSPLKRTCTTAAILAEPHGLELKTLEDLIEINQGVWEGRHVDDISRGWPELWRQSRTDPSEFTMPKGESFKQVTERAVRAFEAIVAGNQDRQSILVAHEIVVKVIIVYVLGATNRIYRRFEINNASLSTIQVIDGKSRLLTINDISHLL